MHQIQLQLFIIRHIGTKESEIIQVLRVIYILIGQLVMVTLTDLRLLGACWRYLAGAAAARSGVPVARCAHRERGAAYCICSRCER